MKKTWIRRTLLAGSIGMLALPVSLSGADGDPSPGQDEKQEEKRVVVERVVNVEQDDEEVEERRVRVRSVSRDDVVVESDEPKVIVFRSDDDGGEVEEKRIQFRVRLNEEGDGEGEGRVKVVPIAGTSGGRFTIRLDQDGDVEEERVIIKRLEGGSFIVDEEEDDDDSSASDRRFRVRVVGEDGEQEDAEVEIEKAHRIIQRIQLDREHEEGDHPKAIQMMIIGEGGDGDHAKIWKHIHGAHDGDGPQVFMIRGAGGEDGEMRFHVIGEDDLHQDEEEEDHSFRFLRGDGDIRVELLRNWETHRAHDEEAHDHEHEAHDHEHGDHAHEHGDHEHGERVRQRVIELSGDHEKIHEHLKSVFENHDLPEEVMEMLHERLGNELKMHIEIEKEEIEDAPRGRRIMRLHRHDGEEDEEVEFDFEFDEAEAVEEFRLNRVRPIVADRVIRWHAANAEEVEEDDDEEELEDRLEALEDRLIRLERKIDRLLDKN